MGRLRDGWWRGRCTAWWTAAGTRRCSALSSGSLKTALASREDALRSAIEERVREQGGRLVGWALGASIARRVLGLVNAELDKMSPDGSELRLAFDEWVRREINRMETEPERAAEIGTAIRRVVAHETVQAWMWDIWARIRVGLESRHLEAERPSGGLHRGRSRQSGRHPGGRSGGSGQVCRPPPKASFGRCCPPLSSGSPSSSLRWSRTGIPKRSWTGWSYGSAETCNIFV